ncbi:MAG: hypothetical protein Q7U54_16595 [Bacteroidales bacterium]|nr:hypothetical protein [Bacteroidales bacterium]
MKRKQNIVKQTDESEQLSPVLTKLRNETQGFKVPDGYFDSLSPRIVDEIKKRENRLIVKILVPSFRKPLVWVPTLATAIVAILLIFVIPAKKISTIPVADEWTEINMAYDASYAEEALLAESYTYDKEIESSVITNNASASLIQNEPTDDEITKYLKDHEIDTDIINEY